MTKSAAYKAARLVANGMSKRKAILKVGYKNGSNTSILTKNSDFQHATNALQNALLNREKKLFERIAERMSQGMDATRVISAVNGKLANGSTSDFIEVPDQRERRKWCEFIMRAFGLLDENKPWVQNTINLVQLVEQARAERGLPIDGG